MEDKWMADKYTKYVISIISHQETESYYEK